MNVYDIRRENARLLANEVGGICAFAKIVHKSQSQISHLIGSKTRRKIGDKLSYQIERSFNKSRGWLDQNNAEPHYKSIPLITWKQVIDWCSLKNKNTCQFNYIGKIPVTIAIGPNSYALRIESDCMESIEGISFIKNSIIIVDPDQKAVNGDFIITHLNNHEFVTFRQLNILF